MQAETAGEGDRPAGRRPLWRTSPQAPAALQRRLRQIGVVSKADGLRLRDLLKPGQRLVTQEGDLWRWDGFTAAAEAPSPAARRLAEKNRLGDLEREAAEGPNRPSTCATRRKRPSKLSARQLPRDAGHRGRPPDSAGARRRPRG